MSCDDRHRNNRYTIGYIRTIIHFAHMTLFPALPRQLPPAAAYLLLALAAGGACAQAPLRMSNSEEALRQYEQATLDSLRERCAHTRSEALRERADVADIRNGFVTTAEDSRRGQQRYSLFAYDRDKRLFTLIDGQRLGRDARLTLPLALPRDYAYCRIVRNAQAQEFVEVVHVARNEVSSIDAANRMHDNMRQAARPLADTRPAAEGPLACANLNRSGAAIAPTQLLSDGEAWTVPSCPDALLYMAERTDRLLRKVFGR